MQERLEEKDAEVTRLKQELQQRSIIEETAGLDSHKKLSDEGHEYEEVENKNS